MKEKKKQQRAMRIENNKKKRGIAESSNNLCIQNSREILIHKEASITIHGSFRLQFFSFLALEQFLSRNNFQN